MFMLFGFAIFLAFTAGKFLTLYFLHKGSRRKPLVASALAGVLAPTTLFFVYLKLVKLEFEPNSFLVHIDPNILHLVVFFLAMSFLDIPALILIHSRRWLTTALYASVNLVVALLANTLSTCITS